MRQLLSVLFSTLQGGLRGGLLFVALLATTTVFGQEYYSPISVTDGTAADWELLPPAYVASATHTEGCSLDGLKSVKVFCNDNYLNFLVEVNLEVVTDLEWTPFQVFINSDNSSSTGGFGDLWKDADTDLMLETAIYSSGYVNSYNPAVFKWWGEVGGSGWFWTDPDNPSTAENCWGAIVCEGSYPAVGTSQMVDGDLSKVEIQILKERVPAQWADEFTIGFKIDQSWINVGHLPNAADDEDGTEVLAEKLRVQVCHGASGSLHQNGLYYEITSNVEPYTVAVVDADADVTMATIPETIEYYGKTYAVTSIGSSAFSSCSSLVAISIPNSVTSIENYAFYNCSSLRSAIIGNGISKIENNTFENCSTLSYFAIGSRVENVGNRAFSACPIDTLFLRNPIPPTFESIGLAKNSISRIYVPCGSYSAYKNSSWNNYAKYSSSFEDDNVFFLNTNVTDSVAGRVETVSEANCDKGYTIKAVPTVGYEFVQWSDGVTDALRTLDLTQDTTLIAEFRQLFDGKCGDNLYWKHYDDKIIIHGEGTMYDYAADSVPWYQFRDIVKTVEVFDGATSIGNNAFALCKNLNTLTLSGTIENIGENAFGGCRMLFDIYCYVLFPPIASETSFVNYNAYLYILCDYQRYYAVDMVFGNFRNMQCIGTQSTPTEGMVITPSYNDVTITWPTESNAGSYTLAINKDGEVFCTLTFNATGQLTGIAFAPSRNGQRHAPAATQAANGFTFTVTGLDEGTDYSYNLVIKDNSGKTLQTYSGEFRTRSTSDRTVTVECDATQGQVTGAGVYQVGDTVTLTAIPNDGYRFVRWSNDVENNPYTFVISENIMLSAEFTIEQTAVENTHSQSPMTNCQKIIRDNQLLILRDDKTYNTVGQIVE